MISILVGLSVLTGSAYGAQSFFGDAETVEFESAAYVYPPTPFAIKQAKKTGTEPKTRSEPPVPVSGYLSRPDGEGPFPAVVLLHSCAGISNHEGSWASRLVEWGYVVLTVDSLKPRGIEYICDGRTGTIAPWNRALDAYGAKDFLSAQSYVIPDRIAAIGFSHGAMTVLEIVKQSTLVDQPLTPFRAAIAYYPLCGQPESQNTPVLVLIGSDDTWTPAIQCEQYLEGLDRPHSMTVHTFPGAHHLFDHPDIDIKELGHTLRSDPAAAEQAFRMTRDFLDDHLP